MSGLVTEADHKAWSPVDLQPYIDHVLDCFGFDRLVFGGDWPVATLAAEYPLWVRTLDDALQGCSPDEQRKLYVANGEAFYRI
jgi:L-fuconolactonase